jgi:hypothetical protein
VNLLIASPKVCAGDGVVIFRMVLSSDGYQNATHLITDRICSKTNKYLGILFSTSGSLRSAKGFV